MVMGITNFVVEAIYKCMCCNFRVYDQLNLVRCDRVLYWEDYGFVLSDT